MQYCFNTPVAVLHRINFMQSCPEAQNNIAQKKLQEIQAMFWEQHLVTVYKYLYIRYFTSKKYNVILNLLWKSVETKAEAVALHSTQEPVKSLVRQYLNK